MKLISTFFTKKTLAIALLMLANTFTNARMVSATDVRRVFWNKFDATVTGENTIVLTWNVTEYNNKNFLVQQSSDGIAWIDIAIISSKNNSEPMVDYSYTYSNNNSGKQYYRLQDIDIDYKSTGYSQVRTVVLSKKIDKPVISIWPNPATERINITGFSSNNNFNTKVFIYDLSGKMVAEKQFEENGSAVYVQDLPAGAYFIRIQSDSGKIFNQKFVKQ